MTPRLMYPAQPELKLNKMSVAQLEQFVSCIVRTSCGNGANSEQVESKSKRWSRDVAFSYPLTRARSTDSGKWRETLLNVVARCTNRGKDSIYKEHKLPTRRRLKSIDIVSNGSDENQNNNLVCKNISDDKYSLSECFPVVRLSDVMKRRKEIYTSKPVNKKDFLNYFKLSDTQNCSVIVNSSNACKKYDKSPLHLLNTHNVPFSSDLGRKLTKECHYVSEEIHQRKIERTERYLTTVISTDTAKRVEYEVSFNKLPDYARTYVFPNKIYRRKGRLSSKATFLLINFCKPCTVKLEDLKLTKNINQIVPGNLVSSTTENPNFKENLPVPLTDNDIISEIKKNDYLNTVVPKCEKYVLKTNNQQNNLEPIIMLSPIKDLLGLNSPKTENKKKKVNNNNIKRKNLKVVKINRVQKKRVIIYETRRFSLRVLRLRCITTK